MIQVEEQDKTEKNEMEKCNLPIKEFKVMVIKILNKLRRRMNTEGT